jgi:beta-galactosidase
VLYTDSRTGVKDESGLCHARTLPGLLSDALGIQIEEYESLGAAWGRGPTFTYRLVGEGPLSGDYTATHTAEWAQPVTADVLARYDEWHLAPYAAATRNKYGRGYAYFVGTVPEEAAFFDSLVADMLSRAGVPTSEGLPLGVERSERVGAGKRLLFLMNHTEQEQRVPVPAGKRELLTGVETGRELVLDRLGVAVIQLS